MPTEASVTLKDGLSFSGTATSGYELNLGASPSVGGADDGFRPLELMLISLVGCTAMDVISILRKKRQEVTDFVVRAEADQAESHPHVFTAIRVEYEITGHHVEEAAVERAIELSITRYCPAQAMLGQVVPIDHTYTIHAAA